MRSPNTSAASAAPSNLSSHRTPEPARRLPASRGLARFGRRVARFDECRQRRQWRSGERGACGVPGAAVNPSLEAAAAPSLAPTPPGTPHAPHSPDHRAHRPRWNTSCVGRAPRTLAASRKRAVRCEWCAQAALCYDERRWVRIGASGSVAAMDGGAAASMDGFTAVPEAPIRGRRRSRAAQESLRASRCRSRAAYTGGKESGKDGAPDSGGRARARCVSRGAEG